VVAPLAWLLAVALMLFAMFLMIVFTLGTVFVMESKPLAKIWSVFTKLIDSSDSMTNITQFCLSVSQWVSLAGMVMATAALVFASIGKSKSKVLKIVLNAIFLALFTFVFIFQMVS
jgi:hypothetical protein